MKGEMFLQALAPVIDNLSLGQKKVFATSINRFTASGIVFIGLTKY
ncbi:MAG: hypothetical protein GWP06_14765 [Actinobacteria bacterium]|nr:hypothetical protein [Actinomycetota bacterium]